jgi:hypothetical protein
MSAKDDLASGWIEHARTRNVRFLKLTLVCRGSWSATEIATGIQRPLAKHLTAKGAKQSPQSCKREAGEARNKESDLLGSLH